MKKDMPPEIKKVLRGVSRTLYLSMNILPEPLRTQTGLAYLLCRVMDIVCDAPGISLAGKAELLARMQDLDAPAAGDRLEELLKRYAHAAGGPGENELLVKFSRVHSLYARLPEEEKELFRDLISSVGAGFRQDLEYFPAGGLAALPDAAALENYCALTGGAAGRFWARLYRGAIRNFNPAVSELPEEAAGEALGEALQMTNLLKDIPADLAAGRCYLPLKEVEFAALSPAALRDPASLPRAREMLGKWLVWALDRLDRSEAFLISVPKTALAMRAAVIWPVYWAMETLEAVASSNPLDPADRPQISRARIFSTLASTPPLLLSNTAFARGYRFRRETLILSLNGGNYQGRAL